MLEQNTMVTNCLEDAASQGLFASLIDVLTREIAIYNELKQFLAEEKTLLMQSATLSQLNESNAQKENIILKARILEEGRIHVLKKIARTLGLDEEPEKLMSLAHYAVIEQRQVIARLKAELVTVARDIRMMNSENQYILDASMNNVKGTLEFISSLLDRSGVYRENGMMNEMGRNGRLLRTEG